MSQKMKKRGDKLYPKHYYANPLDYTLFIFNAMCVYFSLLSSIWSDENQYLLFIKPRAKYGYASRSYTYCIMDWLTKFCDHIDNFI